ncbi:hypothetical protein KAS50_10105 [bacterium]|nr:hypothetical protein [bacterium]
MIDIICNKYYISFINLTEHSIRLWLNWIKSPASNRVFGTCFTGCTTVNNGFVIAMDSSISSIAHLYYIHPVFLFNRCKVKWYFSNYDAR